MFARFDENPAMTFQDIKETKGYGRTHGRTHGRTDGQHENSIPTTNKVCGGYKYNFMHFERRNIILCILKGEITGIFFIWPINNEHEHFNYFRLENGVCLLSLLHTFKCSPDLFHHGSKHYEP